jgi:hypothetical protein
VWHCTSVVPVLYCLTLMHLHDIKDVIFVLKWEVKWPTRVRTDKTTVWHIHKLHDFYYLLVIWQQFQVYVNNTMCNSVSITTLPVTIHCNTHTHTCTRQWPYNVYAISSILYICYQKIDLQRVLIDVVYERSEENVLIEKQRVCRQFCFVVVLHFKSYRKHVPFFAVFVCLSSCVKLQNKICK